MILGVKSWKWPVGIFYEMYENAEADLEVREPERKHGISGGQKDNKR